jgi:hypothetical protein
MTKLRTSFVLLAVAFAPAASAQSAAAIAARVTAAPDGEVRLAYASRPDVCGDGSSMINIGHGRSVSGLTESDGSWNGFNCMQGPARVALTVREHRVVGIRTRVGGSWPAGGAVLDLGTVPAREAAAYLVSLAPQFSESSGRNPLFAAVLADSADLTPDLLRLARGGSRQAVSALGVVDTDASLAALMDLARHGTDTVRKSAVFWVGQSDEPRARALLNSVIADENETIAVRKSAIFALGQEHGSVADLISLYDGLKDSKLREHVIFVLAQRDEEAAMNELMKIARTDENRAMRGKALFWLAQKDDPRVAKLIAEIVSR